MMRAMRGCDDVEVSIISHVEDHRMFIYPARGSQYNLAVFELRLEEGNERDGESESSRYLLSLV
jgi:hypothetical protein